MPDYERSLEFGINIDPAAAGLDTARALARRADELGFDLIGIQDHPYQYRFLDTWMLIASLLAETGRSHIFPNVTNLPLRAPALIAKQAASLDVLSGGRFELGIGAGGFWDAIAAMGGPRRAPGEAVAALEEAIQIIRLFWAGQRTISFAGQIYSVTGLHPGPAPLHPIGIWVGGYRPKMLELTGRLADGWVPSLPYAPPAQVPAMQRRIDEAAQAAGRPPAGIRRIYNLMGQITDGANPELLQGPVAHWVDELTRFALELGFDTFVFWPREDPLAQLERFAGEVMPALRAAVGRGPAPGA